MKILFAGDYSGFHGTIAAELRRQGHECTVMSDGSRCMDTNRDIDIKRTPGMIGSLKYLAKLLALTPRLKGYDIVQIINPGFYHLKPEKLKWFFKRLKTQNGMICLSLAGSDSKIVDALINDSPLRYSEFKIGDRPTKYTLENKATIDEWLAKGLKDYCNYVYDNVDGVVSALYDYHVIGEKNISVPIEYGGIPVDVDGIQADCRIGEREKLKMLVGIKSEMETFKGTDILLEAAKAVERRHGSKLEVDVARDLPLNEYLEKLKEADIVLDQIYSYTPATNALQTMAMGKITVSGAEPEFYEFIGEDALHPIINVTPYRAEIEDKLEELIMQPADVLRKLSEDGRRFVEKHNSSEVVAKRFLKAWERMRK